MSLQVKVNVDTGKILKKFGFGADRGAGRYAAGRVKERCDKYVPKDTGLLKNTAKVSGDRVTYVQPYAKKQFYGDYRHTDPRRGKFWHRRMLQKEGQMLEAEVKRYVKRRGG